MRVGRYETQFTKALHQRIRKALGLDWLPMCWYYPTDNWITNTQEIINAICQDDEIGIKDGRK